MKIVMIFLIIFLLSGCTIKPVFVINLAGGGVIVQKERCGELNECVEKWIEHHNQTRDIDKALEKIGKERK